MLGILIEAEAKARADAEKAAIAKMSKEEKEVYLTKKNLSLAESSLKEYKKVVSDAKSAESKADKALQSQTKATANAKKSFEEASTKLQTAKKQKMPTSAIKELSEIECTYHTWLMAKLACDGTRDTVPYVYCVFN